MKRLMSVLVTVAVLLSFSFLLSSCKSKGGGGGGTTPPPVTQTTTVSGKVTLSSTVTGAPAAKAALKAMMHAPKGKPGSALYYATKQSVGGSLGKTLMTASAASSTPLANAKVLLYNADHPEWLCPVAESTTDSNGNYTLSTMTGSLSTGVTYASCNGDAYVDGDELVAAKYTLLAIKAGGFDPILGVTTPTVVAVQTVVKNFEGAVSGNDLVAQPSDATPTVGTMFGVGKNTDGTQTWGSSSTSLAANAAIQFTFNMAMSRGTLENGVSISPAVSGTWSLSADWLTATFYPASGVTLTPGTTYTVTVKGSDTSTTPIRNVYGNALAKTATGTFTAAAVDTVAPTAIWVSPSTLDMASAVDVIKPIRIGANKQLDINGLLLDGKVGGVSSFGAKPGVLFLGKETTGTYAGYYIYEFVLAEPLKLSTTYELTVTGGKGLNGLAMIDLSGSLVTVSAALSTGISATADTTTQTAQAQVKDVFGKWSRAFSDRNLTQLQSVMSGDFYFEYDPSYGIDGETDLNRDGRYSMQEFSDMLAAKAFPMWKYCGTTITGDVIGTINVVGENADFEFKLIGTSTITSQQCTDTMPDASLYATLQKINGAWVIVRTSEGIDTRTKTISYPKLINIELSQGGTVIADGGKLASSILNDSNPATFSWDAVSGAMSYVLMIMDSRDPGRGIAMAMPTSMLSMSTNVKNIGEVDVSCKFGFCRDGSGGIKFVEGGEYLWEVVALGTIAKADIANKSDAELLRDIAAVSSLDRFSIDGVFKELKVTIYPGASATGTPLTYNEMFGGYDAGASVNKATLLISTPSTSNVFIGVNVNASSSKFYAPTTPPTCNATTGCTATVTVDLFKGWNWISVNDGTGVTGGPQTGGPGNMGGLYKEFSVQAPDGIPPVISITSVKNQAGTAITGDSWGYYDSTKLSTGATVSGATSVTITGSVSAMDPATNTATNITQVNVNVWNNDLGAYSYVSAPVTSGVFTATVEIYKGDNWININSDSGGTGGGMYNAHAGVFTDTGTVWVAPITLTDVVGATMNYDWGNSSDWDASTDLDDKVTVKIKFKAPLASTGNCGTSYSYNIWSEGAGMWSEVTPNIDGSLSLDVELYTGWNYVSFNDPNCNWYGVNIYTSDGKVVLKPTITTIDGSAYTYPTQGGTGSASISDCQVTITGTAQAGDVQVNWNGFDGVNYWYEQQMVQTTGGSATTPGSFTATMPVVSGTGAYNNIDVYDLNWKWTGVKVTTTGTCPYSPPVLTIGTVKDDAGATLTSDGYSYQAGTSNTVTISGASTRSGDVVTARVWACGVEEKFTGTAATAQNGSGTYDWSISGVKVYGNNGMGQNTYIDVYNNYTWTSVNVYSTNTQLPPPAPLNVVSMAGDTTPDYEGCGYKEWDFTLSGTAVQTVTIVGTTTAPDGEGHYNDPIGGSHPFTITGGAFTILDVPVYDGYNNISINDTAWNWTNVSVRTMNGVAKPKAIAITSLMNGQTGIIGVQSVAGSVIDPNFNPSQIHAYASIGKKDAYGYCNWTSTDYTTDQYQQSNFGYQPITYDSVNKTFSFSVDFGDGSCDTYLSVDANDNVTYAYHGHSLSVNTVGYTPWENWYKPGAKKGPSAKQVLNEQRALMRRLAIGVK